MSATLIRHLCTAAAAIMSAACVDNTISRASVGAIVTVVDSGSALSSARTFVLPDTVISLSMTTTTLDPKAEHELVAQVRAHFVALGWTEVPNAPASHPDVLVLMAASTRIQTGVYYGDWFSAWGYLPYWGAGVDASWAWGVPSGVVPYDYQAGTLLVTMIDIRAPRDDTKTIPLLWAAALDGAVGDASTMARVQAGIDQAFEQSPYLRVN